MMNKKEFLAYLDSRGTEYELYEHKAVFTVEEANELGLPHPEAGAKNLFLRDRRKKNYYLITMRDGISRSFKELQELLCSTPVSFASEEDLWEILGLRKGSVTPFGALNDPERKVNVYLDSYYDGHLMSAHPNENTATLFLEGRTALEILRENGVKAAFLDLGTKEEDRMTEEQKKEAEKRDAGKLYRPSVFLGEMFAARDKCEEYARIPMSQFEKRVAFIREFFGHAGKDPVVENGFHCNQGTNISVGDNFYCNFNCTIYDSCAVTIGDNVMFGPSVTVCTATHPVEAAARLNPNGAELAFPVTIGNNVWIGGGAFINPGVTIGDGAVIASGAVVTKDVPANTLAAGVPAEIKKHIDNDRNGECGHGI